MKTLKKILVLVLALALVFSFVACDGEETPANQDANQTEVKRTPRPTPKPQIVDITAEQLNNYYVAYSVTKTDATVMVQDENGNYVPKTEAANYVEVGFSNLVLESKDGGETFAIGGSQCFNSTADITQYPKTIFNVHMNYEKAELENKGTETVAGKECTHYYYKNGLLEAHMYVDETFGTTGICLKYEAVGYAPQVIEVTELKFGVINNEEGYEFATFQSKQATPAPVEEAPAA